MDLRVSSLHVYPIKSCRGIDLDHAEIGKRGILYDRSFLLVDDSGSMLTQRDIPGLALVEVKLDSVSDSDNRFLLSAPSMTEFELKISGTGKLSECQVWDDSCKGMDQGEEVASWFTEYTGRACRLLAFPDQFVRPVNPKYASAGHELAYADGFPFLLVSQASLDDLNSKLEFPVSMTRFRPNIVVSGCDAFAEDQWKRIAIGALEFEIVKPCARCVIVTIDQDDAVAGKEPLRTLALYRKQANKILFGQNLVHHACGSISVGDQIEVLKC